MLDAFIKIEELGYKNNFAIGRLKRLEILQVS